VREIVSQRADGGLVTLDELPEPLRTTATAVRTDAASVARPAEPKGDLPTASQMQQLVERYRGNVREIATFLGKDRKQVYRWLKHYDIEPKHHRSG
jgi:transcriptional regulator of acetoin/glycerol metabolism